MVASIVFGSDSPTHPEFQSFFQGLNLATNNGFKLSEVSDISLRLGKAAHHLSRLCMAT